MPIALLLLVAVALGGAGVAGPTRSVASASDSLRGSTPLGALGANADSARFAALTRTLATGCRCPGVTDSVDVTGDPLLNPAHSLHEGMRDSLRDAMDCWKDGTGFHDWCCGDTRPEILHSVDPAYPESLRRGGANDTVVALCFVNRDGRVARVERKRGRPELYDATFKALCQWSFKPCTWVCENGASFPVGVWVAVPFVFLADSQEGHASGDPGNTAIRGDAPPLRSEKELSIPSEARDSP
ncbi:energy transducer TonB [Candidatus Fermentibacteria bacterium]|nr:energy transducer TonB [Candidatus Fermentibacteria bacterium]